MKKLILTLYPASLMALFLFAGTACSDDDDYAPAPEVAADCMSVYFPNSNASEYVLMTEDEKAITLTVSRKVTAQAASVPVVVNSKDAIFEIPSTVEFAEGEANAALTVSFPSIEIRKTCAFDISLADEYVDSYAEKDGTGRFIASVAVDEWQLNGTATFTFASVYSSMQSKIYWLESMNFYKIENFLNSGVNMEFRLGDPFDYSGKCRIMYPRNYYTDMYSSWTGYTGWCFYDTENDDYMAWNPEEGKKGIVEMAVMDTYSAYTTPYSYICLQADNEGNTYNSGKIYTYMTFEDESTSWNSIDFSWYSE